MASDAVGFWNCTVQRMRKALIANAAPELLAVIHAILTKRDNLLSQYEIVDCLDDELNAARELIARLPVAVVATS